jgi:hypothetical protein
MASRSFTIADHSFTNRRGVLLLIVLSMLSLFMMLGVAFVIMASRARDASRGFARAISPAVGKAIPSERLLDKAAMLLIRGPDSSSPAPSPLPGGGPFSFESLLEDQYGSDDTVTGQCTFGAGDNGDTPLPLLGITPTEGNALSALQLTGRIITIIPPSGRASSHRIRLASGTGNFNFTVAVAANNDTKRLQHTLESIGLPEVWVPPGTTFVINSRERCGVTPTATNEPWDGYDYARNSFLAHIEPVPSDPSSATVIRASMFDLSGDAIRDAPSPISPSMLGDVDGDGVSDACDNDNDGIVDGQFFDPGFPPLTAPEGGSIVTHMSCLIVDLDGRLNANAHGTIASAIYPSNYSRWPANPSDWAQIPLGSGYGPAEIDASKVFDAFSQARQVAPSADTPWTNLLLGSQPQIRSYGGGQLASSIPAPGCRIPPLILPTLEGRYAGSAQARPLPVSGTTLVSQSALPGVTGSNDLLSTYNERPFAGVRSPIDLHGRMKSLSIAPSAGAAVPTLIFSKPDASDELTDDPYEVLLNGANERGVDSDPQTLGLGVSTAPDNTFSVAELERILRPYDPDSLAMPQRLFGHLGPHAEVGRLTVTTDSWDVPVVSGSAAARVFGAQGWLAGIAPQALLQPTRSGSVATGIVPQHILPVDFKAGLKVNVELSGTSPRSSSLTSVLQKRVLFKDLFLTCVALVTPAGQNPSAANAARYAQWAANVVEYQDADSTMTEFEYDSTPLDGWDVDGNPRTGDEVKEPTRAVVWGAERPEIVITQTLAWEDDKAGELFIVMHRPWNSRLLLPGTTLVAEPSDPQLRSSPTAAENTIALNRTTPNGDPVWRLRIGSGANSPIVRFDKVLPNSPDLGATNTPPFVAELETDSWVCVKPGSESREQVAAPPEAKIFEITKGDLRAPAGTKVVRLERLAKPDNDYDESVNPYIVVDAADVTVTSQSPDAREDHVLRTRDLGWNQHFDSKTFEESPRLTTEWNGSPAWMMWPNRPLISLVELTHVPGFAEKSFRPRSASETTEREQVEGILANYTPPEGLTYLPDPLLLEVLRIPSRFSGTRMTLNTPINEYWASALDNLGIHDTYAEVNQIDTGREPGRINVNTISSDPIWAALVGGTVAGSAIPKRSATQFATLQATGGTTSVRPAQALLDVLALDSSGTAIGPFRDTPADIPDANRNPLHRMHTATRLANMATNRSHMFGVWITLRTMETTNGIGDPDSVQFHRMFLIYDRSRPVAYEPGKDHNVRDGIRLRRILQ